LAKLLDISGYWPYIATAVAMVMMALVGIVATDIGPWYRSLIKPSWQPPDWLFGPVWTTIYVLITLSIGLAWNAATAEQRQLLLVLLLINIVLNMLWSVLFFTLKRPTWAMFEIVLLWGSIVSLMWAVSTYKMVSLWLLAPYLLWATFAATLNASIIKLNP